jgi:hypothetical protein
MAKTSISNDAKRAAEMYKKADELYARITKNFESIEGGEVKYSTDKFKFIKLQSDLKLVRNMLTKIDTDSLVAYVGQEKVNTMENNITFMIENSEYIEKRLLADQYVNDLFVPVKHYLEQFMGDESNYKKWSTNISDLARKFVGMMTHPNNIDNFKGYLKRIMLGTMTLREFKKIWESSKHKMVALYEPNSHAKFESFTEYKTYNYEA